MSATPLPGVLSPNPIAQANAGESLDHIDELARDDKVPKSYLRIFRSMNAPWNDTDYNAMIYYLNNRVWNLDYMRTDGLENRSNSYKRQKLFYMRKRAEWLNVEKIGGVDRLVFKSNLPPPWFYDDRGRQIAQWNGGFPVVFQIIPESEVKDEINKVVTDTLTGNYRGYKAVFDVIRRKLLLGITSTAVHEYLKSNVTSGKQAAKIPRRGYLHKSYRPKTPLERFQTDIVEIEFDVFGLAHSVLLESHGDRRFGWFLKIRKLVHGNISGFKKNVYEEIKNYLPVVEPDTVTTYYDKIANLLIMFLQMEYGVLSSYFKGENFTHLVTMIQLEKIPEVAKTALPGKLLVMTVVDVFSKFVWLRVLKHSASSADQLSTYMVLRELFLSGEKPKILQMDAGSEFNNSSIRNLCERFQIKPVINDAGTPQQNGFIERLHRTIRTNLIAQKIALQESEGQYQNNAPQPPGPGPPQPPGPGLQLRPLVFVLQELQFNINNVINATTKLTPFMAHRGFDPNFKTAVSGPTERPVFVNANSSSYPSEDQKLAYVDNGFSKTVWDSYESNLNDGTLAHCDFDNEEMETYLSEMCAMGENSSAVVKGRIENVAQKTEARFGEMFDKKQDRFFKKGSYVRIALRFLTVHGKAMQYTNLRRRIRVENENRYEYKPINALSFFGTGINGETIIKGRKTEKGIQPRNIIERFYTEEIFRVESFLDEDKKDLGDINTLRLMRISDLQGNRMLWERLNANRMIRKDILASNTTLTAKFPNPLLMLVDPSEIIEKFGPTSSSSRANQAPVVVQIS